MTVSKEILKAATEEYRSEQHKPHPTEDKFEAEIKRLAKLSKLEYAKARKDTAKNLGITAGALDDIVKEAQGDAESGTAELVKTVEPWEEPIVLGDVLDDVRRVFDRHIVCDATVKTAATLWVAYSWCIEHVPFAPLAIITAPEKACGKTQLLEVMGRLSRKPLMASGISPAAVFRVVDAEKPTLLIDEADTFVKSNEELRGIINCGHSRTSPYIIRTVGENFEPKAFNVFGAKL
ncbi:MAG: hypothetical protein EB015_21210, partial [Methylocystaceae bacterium]|nr:hypothetical protein [Methylocystaceae bacterium]